MAQTVHFPHQCKKLAIRTFFPSPEGMITVAVVRLLDDRFAWF
jgi:hypothetical protein